MILIKQPTDINTPKFLQEILIGGAYSLAKKKFSSEFNHLLNLLPMTCIELKRQTETKVV